MEMLREVLSSVTFCVYVSLDNTFSSFQEYGLFAMLHIATLQNSELQKYGKKHDV